MKEHLKPDYWALYKAINFRRYSKTRTYYDPKIGKKMEYRFIGADCFKGNILLSAFSVVLWLSPVVLIILPFLPKVTHCPWMLIFPIMGVIIYHFWAMYYIIRGPFLEVKAVKKISFFSKK